MAAELGLGGHGSGVERFGAILRDLQDRVRRLESRRTLVTGQWVISEEEGTGNLIATNRSSGNVITLGTP